MNSPKKFAIVFREIAPHKYFPVFAQVRIQAPHVFAQKLIPQEYSCMYWFCEGGNSQVLQIGLTGQGRREDGAGGAVSGPVTKFIRIDYRSVSVSVSFRLNNSEKKKSFGR